MGSHAAAHATKNAAAPSSAACLTSARPPKHTLARATKPRVQCITSAPPCSQRRCPAVAHLPAYAVPATNACHRAPIQPNEARLGFLKARGQIQATGSNLPFYRYGDRQTTPYYDAMLALLQYRHGSLSMCTPSRSMSNKAHVGRQHASSRPHNGT